MQGDFFFFSNLKHISLHEINTDYELLGLVGDKLNCWAYICLFLQKKKESEYVSSFFARSSTVIISP